MKIEQKDNRVIIDGVEIEGFIDKKQNCPICKLNLVYFENFDAYFCPNCNNSTAIEHSTSREESIINKFRTTIFILDLFLIISIPCSFFYVLNNGNPYTKYLVEKYVPVYLKQKGYTDRDFKARHYVEPKYLINKDVYHGHYEVIFKDEPNTSYYYGVTKKGKEVIQFCEKDVTSKDGITDTTTQQLEHGEKNCLHSSENR